MRAAHDGHYLSIKNRRVLAIPVLVLILLASIVAPAVGSAAISTPATESDLTGTWIVVLHLVKGFAGMSKKVSKSSMELLN